jgi:hypothetical protein
LVEKRPVLRRFVPSLSGSEHGVVIASQRVVSATQLHLFVRQPLAEHLADLIAVKFGAVSQREQVLLLWREF